MKKKVLATLLSTVMVLGTLAGCGSSTADTSSSETATETKEEVKEETNTEAAAETQTQAAEGTASSDFSGEDPQLAKDFHILSIWAEDNDNGVLINSICKSYQEVNPNFTYEYELVSSDDLRQKVATLVASNDLPDMFVYESGKPIVDLIEAGQITDIGALLKEVGSTDFVTPSATSLLQTLSGTDTIYDLPLGLNVEGFWYNKALFEQAGITKAPETWDEFEEVLQKLSDAGIQPLSCGAADKWGATRLINAYTVRSLGADAMKNAAEGKTSYTDEGYVAAAAKIQEWANKGYFGEGVNTVDMNTAGSMLMTGKSAIFYNGSWFASNLNDTTANVAGEDGIGFFNIPVVDDSVSKIDSYSMNCGNILCLSQAKTDEATKWFIKYFVEHIGDVAMDTQGSIKGYTYSAQPTDMSGYTKLVLDEIGKAQSAFTWYEATMGSEVSDAAQSNVQMLFSGEMSPEDYMQSIQDAADMAAN
ncbi:extracellular solute-binding protein [Butyrivibrio sp.]|uniref:extracellular solute-binding protein n=1 Tax=Butyrivibrio sp. TaxID=28121 RepID=UPI0025C5ECC9|nr:extracellular solute-binding protein [Butyrivibrio sp.]MBE5838185.1 extracellular solute-binding protein [Butyrivibrio sp.]